MARRDFGPITSVEQGQPSGSNLQAPVCTPLALTLRQSSMLPERSRGVLQGVVQTKLAAEFGSPLTYFGYCGYRQSGRDGGVVPGGTWG